MSGRPVYLDHAATTPVDARVAARMAECLTVEGTFGNPGSAGHEFGEAAFARVEAARRQVAEAVGAAAAEVIFTSGATEANNLALFGVAQHRADRGRHLVTVRTEHKAVLDPCRELERQGWQVTYLVPDSDGIVTAPQVAAALRPDTVLVSVMHVNNEIGVVQDVAAIAAACARHGSAWLHVDAAQSVGKLPVDFAGWGVHLMSLCAHKAYGPKGVGALLVSRAAGVHLKAQQFGGGQERGLRSGTVPVHQVVGMGEAFELASQEAPAYILRLAALRERLWAALSAMGGVLRNGAPERTVAQVLNVSFAGVEGESLLAGVRPSVAVATGSACNSASAAPSYVLRALGRDAVLAEASLRFSLGKGTTAADVEVAATAVTATVRHLRRVAGQPATGSSVEGGAAAGLQPGGGRPSHYSDLTWRRFLAAEHCGSLTGSGVHRGSAGGPGQGVWVQFDLRLGPANEVCEARFLAQGCPHVLAIADWVCETSVGRSAAAGLPESVHALRARFAAPVEKLGRLLVIEDAWNAALASA